MRKVLALIAMVVGMVVAVPNQASAITSQQNPRALEKLFFFATMRGLANFTDALSLNTLNFCVLLS